MATEIIPPSTAAGQKLSRYRSVRRAQQEQQQAQIQHPFGQFQHQPQHRHPHDHNDQEEQQRQQQQYHQDQPTSPVTAPPLPPMPALPEMQPPKDAPISRSMSRYHRRPTTVSHPHTTLPKTPHGAPLSSTTVPTQQSPPAQAQQLNPPAPRNRPVSSPQHAPHTANTGQPRPKTSRHASDDGRQACPRGDDAARLAMQKERERQRLVREKDEAEAREKREAKEAELNRLEALRLLEEQSVQRNAQQELEDAEALRRQKEELRAEWERSKRLQKAEAQRAMQQKEEQVRRAKQEDRDRRAAQEQASQTSQAPRKAQTSSPTASPPRQDVGFGLFKRRKDAALYPDGPPKFASPPQVAQSRNVAEPETIRPGGGGAVLGIDAPTSAVNAGDRLPVTPTTTPLDLIKSAAVVLADPINVRTAVLSELFAKVSITRPLRNYEYVRDVMNSWDYDSQNELTIIDADMDGINQDDLLSYKVPETRPEGMSCFIQYSSRPGKWSKRYMTLRPDGQLVMAKNEKAKEKDQENILTLTDYDIYSITQQKLARVKPPKRICYAVKSMQKSNIFADESQYVHFFCTNDRGTATTFYQALQRWRSWYLKHQKGEGVKKKTPVATSRNVSGAEPSQAQASHVRGESVGSHYQLGAFKPLLDMNDFNKALDDIEVHRPGEFPDDKPLAKLDTQAMHARKRSVRVKQPPPTAFSRSALAAETTSQPLGRSGSVRRSSEQSDDETFASGGLLGRAYTQRQAALQAREQETAGPFIEGPSLLNNMSRLTPTSTNESGLIRSSSVRSTHQRASSDLKRSASRRIPGMPQPLVDLTPSYQPPPQFASKGKGRGYSPGSSAQGPLVESATSPEEAIKVPSSTDWRARPGSSRPAHGTYGTNGHERTRSLKGRGEPLAAYTQNNHAGAPEDATKAFTGGGLVATAGFSQGHAPVGRGVMDGSKAKGPMLDFKDDLQFASGSLLSGLPSSSELVIDRSGK
ncbi:hypothetical protein LEMA_P013910.1 [Plenodomus lingam JN3]|uniref:PH domain-containing protein n=1 Tax=Leptosphaeria maculans (strain JN3 / isolate v23.1.3 / race Av1-4-5-6-7-8) TaxID=985895 RepID=E5A9C0_LEPMJ|nr:hypothetical protein LEMA_P013910.1 [Plenodomus lingam JN3]CBY00261.1 hypothetical protein LEMA_P013910.1 [Plenodomus lingam JN3]